MWGKRIAMVVAVATIATTSAVGLPSPVRAGGPSEPIIADLNGDGLPDQATLGTVTGPPVKCIVTVRLGAPGGGFQPPTTHSYLTLSTVPSCPDLGVAVDLLSAPETDLVVGWFAGRPPGISFDLLLLRNYTMTNGFQAIFQPSFIGLADFDGDHRLDVYEWTDQGDGFATYLNTGTGALVPGPVKYCAGPLQYQLADFNQNGAMDVAIAYIQGCGEFFSGVVVVLDDGTQVNLQGDAEGLSSWTINVTDANGDGIPDVVTYNQVNGEISAFLGVGNGTFVRSPMAVRDYLTVSGTKATGINVLANDYATTRAKVTIWSKPKHGTARVTSSRTIIYTPDPVHGKDDTFIYRITDEGRTSNALVYLKING